MVDNWQKSISSHEMTLPVHHSHDTLTVKDQSLEVREEIPLQIIPVKPQTKMNMALYGYIAKIKEKAPKFDGDLDAVIKMNPQSYEKMVTMLTIAFKKKLQSFSQGVSEDSSGDDTLNQPGYKCPKSLSKN